LFADEGNRRQNFVMEILEGSKGMSLDALMAKLDERGIPGRRDLVRMTLRRGKRLGKIKQTPDKAFVLAG
jgi:hypothetical protein